MAWKRIPKRKRESWVEAFWEDSGEVFVEKQTSVGLC